MASPIVRGQDFSSTELVTGTKLQNIVDNAAFKDFDGSTEAFNVSGSSDIGTCLLAGGLSVNTTTGQLQIKDSGVTKAKIENVANMKVLGNTSGSATAPQEVAILDENTMSSDSATSLATQQSIKAFAGMTPVQNGSGGGYSGGESITLPNGLIMKTGFASGTGESVTVNFGVAFPNAVISVQLTQVGGTTVSEANVRVNSISTSSLVMYSNTGSGVTGNYWLVIGH